MKQSDIISIGDMFHDDTIQYKTFLIVCQDETYYCEYDSEYIKPILSQVEAAIKCGDSNVDVSDRNMIYCGRYWDDPILYISWD